MIISEEISIGSVFNRVIKVFNTYQIWQDSMQDIINKTLSIEKFGELAEDIFLNPICMIDCYTRFLFVSVKKDRYVLPNDYWLSENTAFMDPDELNLLKMDEEFTYAIEKTTPTIYFTYLSDTK